MFAAYVIVSLVLAAACAGSAAAMYFKAQPVMESMQAVGAPLTWRVPLSLCKAAGALGLLVGVFGVPVVGEAAAIGVALYFVGALVFHYRAKAPGYPAPAAFLLLALASLALNLSS